jgi:Copper type II ascorbate-dependent monooxygenase, C-terminal domain
MDARGSGWLRVFGSAVAIGGALGVAGEAGAQQGSEVPTYAEDVAPILQQSCQTCHNPEGIGPMSFMTYEEVRPWAQVIKLQTQIRHMPPWHLDRTVGIQEFKNDISLTDAEIETLAAWADGGAPEGDPAKMPAARKFVSGANWQAEAELGRPPDVVLKSTPFTVPGNGPDQWWDASVPFEGLGEERWLMAAEFKPAYPDGKKVVHHGHAVMAFGGGRSSFDSEDNAEGAKGVARYGVGKTWEMLPPGTGMRLPAGPGVVNFNIHYAATDHDVVDDVVEVGLWFYPKGQEPALETEGEVQFRIDNPNFPRGQDILIPPHGYQVLTNTKMLEEAAVIHSIRPHMHTRGKTMTMEAIYPDGTRELLSQVNNYDHNWQNTYTYADHARPILPKGTVLVLTSVYDNTANNPINPDPDQWVIFGRRGPDEMGHLWIGITNLTDEQYIQAMAERNRATN